MQYKWTVLLNTTLGVLISAIDTNIVLIALPRIGLELDGMNAFNVLWVILGYQLVIACVLVNFGRLSDMFGRVKLYNLGFAVFTAGSALCSLSQNADQLILFRVLQATGSAFLFSNSAAIITDAFPARERGMALGINQISIVIGSVLGLVMGGILTSTMGWRSIFWVNIPIGVFATLWSHFKLRELSEPSVDHKLDLGGNITFASGLLVLLLGITLSAVSGLNYLYTILMIGAFGVLMAAFVKIERTVQNPMFRLDLFRNRTFSVGNETIFLNALSRGSFILVMVFYLQGPLMGFGPLEAGLFLIPMSVSLSIAGPISGFLSDRFGFRKFVLVGLAISASGFILMTTTGEIVSESQIWLPLILIGSGMGIFASPNRSSIMNSVDPKHRGVASGISTTLINTGNTMSIGLAFFFMSIATPRATLDLIFSGLSVSSVDFSPVSFLMSVHIVFVASALMLSLSIVLYIFGFRKAERIPAELSVHA